MHIKEKNIKHNIEGIPHIATKQTVIILIGIIILSGNANLLYVYINNTDKIIFLITSTIFFNILSPN